MPTHHDLIDFEVGNSILNNTGGIEVFWDNDIGDIAVNEEITGF
jgi:hypothetical protein